MTFPGLALVARNKFRQGIDERKIEKTLENRITRFKRNSNWFGRVAEENNVVYWYWNWMNLCLNSLNNFTDVEKFFGVGKLCKLLNAPRRVLLSEPHLMKLYHFITSSFLVSTKSTQAIRRTSYLLNKAKKVLDFISRLCCLSAPKRAKKILCFFPRLIHIILFI